MWIFLPAGLLMPSEFPQDKADPKFAPPEKGYELQVRARVKRHLENFCEMYMPLDAYSEIEATPGMDYNFRFYCKKDDFAWAMGQAIADIDYKKFKPTAETKAADGKTLLYGPESTTYHSVLNSIWSTLLRLGGAGGWYGPYDKKTNPNGYKPYEYSTRYITDKYSPQTSSYSQPYRSQGSLPPGVKYSDDKKPMWGEDQYGDVLFNDGAASEVYDTSDMDWMPSQEEEAEIVIDELRGARIPVRDWYDNVTPDEWVALAPFVSREKRAEKRRERRAAKRARKHTAVAR